MDSTITQTICRILSPYKPVAVYVFGSAAAGRLRPDSDLDLAILPADSMPVSSLMDRKIELAEVLNRDVDLIDLSAANTVLRKEVIASGRLLYETDRVRREEFEMYALSDYARLNEERQPVLAALGQRLRAE
jgi:predicted nucleotidyltransferase